MEAAFGHDFGRVRVHSDSAVVDAARRLGAVAFTLGPHVALSRRADFGTPDGRRLLAHELTHTIQQGQISRDSEEKPEVSDDNPAEAEADKAATAIAMSERAPQVRHRSSTPVLQRQLEQPYAGRVRSPVLEELFTQETELMTGLQGIPLTPLEIELARTIFGESIDYSRVRLLHAPEALWFRTVGNTIRIPPFFTVNPNAAARPRPLSVAYMRETFIHELTHVWQYQHGGTSYISYSLGPQIVAMARGRGRDAAYCYEADPKKSFWDFSPEQQGLLVENTFLMRESAQAILCNANGQLGYEVRPDVIAHLLPIHERYVAQMRAALPAPEAAIRMQRAGEVMAVPGSQILPVPPERQLTPVKPLLEWRF